MIKKKRTSKILIRTIIVILIGVVIYHIIWYQVTRSKYEPYSTGMHQGDTGGIDYYLKMRWDFTDDKYIYLVKYPGYLSYVGNLFVGTFDNRYALFIWPGILDETEYGLMLPYNDQVYQIMVDKHLQPLNPDDAVIIETNREEVEMLYERARRRWKEFFDD